MSALVSGLTTPGDDPHAAIPTPTPHRCRGCECVCLMLEMRTPAVTDGLTLGNEPMMEYWSA